MAHAAAQAVRAHPLNPPRIGAVSAQKVVALPSVAKTSAVVIEVAIVTLAAATGVAMRLAATARGIRRAWTARVVPQAVAPCPAAHAAEAARVVAAVVVVDAVNEVFCHAPNFFHSTGSSCHAPAPF